MRGLLQFLSGAITLLVLFAVGGAVYARVFAHGFSARAQPTRVETLLAEAARSAAIPSDAQAKQNPIPLSGEVLQQARAHWADHCATCHGNNGSGQVPLGQQMYPPAPDMRKDSTQKKSDGELFYIIENGVRLTGMPAWGGSSHSADDSWKLVRFIRHLPALSESEIREMEALNPKTPDDLEEEKQEEEFLRGGPASEPAAGHHNH